MYTKQTHHISITVEPTFLEDQSLPADNHYVWAYSIWIENQGAETVQLLSRQWRIRDSKGVVHEVKGEGVVGERPIIQPGASYHYTSGTPLSTPSGIMEGSYYMITQKGEHFEVEIPAFSLDSPYETAVVH
jgi:ApaG protein